jgi:hypothetical protein
MSYIEAYKRLDNLCKDIFQSETGVTTYICNLEEIRRSRFQNVNVDSDYKKLKQCRYKRNQIVHENDVDEEDMCDESDIWWIEEFYQRILHQTDPISLHEKAKAASQQQAAKLNRVTNSAQPQTSEKRTSPKFNIAFIMIVIAFIAIAALWELFWH